MSFLRPTRFSRRWRPTIASTCRARPAFRCGRRTLGGRVALFRLRFCRLSQFRRRDIAAAFSTPAPDCDPAAMHYSVDLTMRFLPDLMPLARSEAGERPAAGLPSRLGRRLAAIVRGNARRRPRSIEPIANHSCLLGIYRDRIITSRDLSRCNDTRVDEAVKQALGERVTLRYR